MLPVLSGPRVLLVACAVFVAVAMTSPATAQSTGMVKGKVFDGKGQPIEAAKVTIEFQDGVSRVYTVKSNKKGEYTQIGLPPGNYKVTAEKEKVGAQSYPCRVRLGDTAEVNFQLAPGTSGPTKEDAAKVAAIKKLFDEGVAASRSGDNDTALAKFTEAANVMPTCYDCYYNIGYAYAQKKEYDKSEEAFKKSIELKADPKHANSHYQLAMCLINLGKLPEAVTEFELYMQLAPDGQYAAQVKAMLLQIKK